ncbi:MAG TPA: ABC transporter permease [Blastocatellia bacterium]|nr:ABC transporter permease [Blastocatellia bacterium]
MLEWKTEIRHRLASLELEPSREAEIAEELSQHLMDRYTESLACGATPEEAYRAALAELDSAELLARELRRVESSAPPEPVVLGSNWRGDMFGGLWQDLRFATRMLLKNPGFTVVAALTLALGIGANTAIFTLMDAVLLKRLPVKQPEQLVEPMMVSGKAYNSFSWQAFQHWRQRNQSLSGLIASSNSRFYCVVEGAAPERVAGQYVTGDFFSVLGVSPAIGRMITPGDDRFEAPNAVAVISDGYWSRRFGRDPAALGKRIVVEDVPLTIVGVAPAEFSGLQVGSRVDLWAPLATEPLMHRPSFTSSAGYKWLQLVGRMKPGISLDQARADLDLLFRPAVVEPELALQTGPEAERRGLDWRLKVEPAGNGLSPLREQFSKPLAVLMVIVGLVLLIACANLANLLLTRAATRGREIAVRLALGAGRARLIRQLLTESLLLSLIGAAAGVLLANFGAQYLLEILESGRTPVLLDVQPDSRALVFTALLSVLTALLYGLAPALRASRSDLIAALKVGGRGLEFGGSRQRLSRSLIVAQIAISLILLVGAGLFLRTLRNLHSIDLGFERENVLLVTLDPSHSGYAPEQTRHSFLALLDGIQAIPGVRSASLSWNPPVAGGGSSRTVSLEGRAPGPEAKREIYVNWVAPRYFETLGVPLMAGRDFGSHDTPTSPGAVILNQTMARVFFGDANPIGQRIRVGDNDIREVVGVVGDSHYLEVREQITPTLYLNTFQSPAPGGEFAIRATGDPNAVIPAVRREIERHVKGMAIANVRTLASQVDAWIVQERLVALLSSCFSGLAMFIAAVGLYGVLSYTVARRTQEIGIRMALGAQPRDVMAMILKEITWLVCLGLALGVPLALILGRFTADLLYGLTPTDPLTIVAGILVMLTVALLAGYVPARRASRVDPMVALRHE